MFSVDMNLSRFHGYEDVNQFAVPSGSSILMIEKDLNRFTSSSKVHSEVDLLKDSNQKHWKRKQV